MSGIRAIVLVCVTSFFLGTLCTHWTADSLTMWNPPLTPAHLASAATYYAHLAHLPAYMLWVLAGLALGGMGVLLTNFFDWRDVSLFDWASLFLYAFSGFIYLYSVIPNILRFATYTTPLTPPTEFPLPLRNPLLELASSHLFCSVALTGVIFLQGGRWWAEGEDETWDQGAEERRRLLRGKKAEGKNHPKKRSGKRRKGLLRGFGRGGGSQ
ncbi:hypothetical protein DACRYDRAFT_19949 [Dacryopinax primogenitus]|uniref:Shr3 amino acid permease chaperone n=1 Tax=Dacryopinax primogenitus (strain DJM 731) TaxID=1858805 RepID=M5GAR9_DACPD|nr:uncharacterized protein DACRYDRAFT_19949 [Dacryopinax primogenitus]EJU05470.1 hypothetical protein DACRYDRAFT_19949 [Dacryopinax primogenitus]